MRNVPEPLLSLRALRSNPLKEIASSPKAPRNDRRKSILRTLTAVAAAALGVVAGGEKANAQPVEFGDDVNNIIDSTRPEAGPDEHGAQLMHGSTQNRVRMTFAARRNGFLDIFAKEM